MGSLFPTLQQMSNREVLAALRGLSHQLMEIEKRIDNLETALSRSPLMRLLNEVTGDSESESSDGYESAPPTFSYPE